MSTFIKKIRRHAAKKTSNIHRKGEALVDALRQFEDFMDEFDEKVTVRAYDWFDQCLGELLSEEIVDEAYESFRTDLLDQIKRDFKNFLHLFLDVHDDED